MVEKQTRLFVSTVVFSSSRLNALTRWSALMRRVILWESISRAISTSRLLYAWADCLAMYVVSLFLPERWHSVYFLPRLHWAEVYRLLHWAWGSVQALTVVSLVIMKLGICNIVLAAAIVSGRALFKKKRKEEIFSLLLAKKSSPCLIVFLCVCNVWAQWQPFDWRGFAQHRCPRQEKWQYSFTPFGLAFCYMLTCS